jgi:hypothetical protein
MINTPHAFCLVLFLWQNTTKHTWRVIYYLSVDFCFSIRSFGLSCPVPLPPFPPYCRMNARKKEMAVIDTKERLLRFFSASATTGMPVFFWKSRQWQVCRSREREYDRKRKKNLLNLLVYFLVFLSIILYHMYKHKFYW